MANTYAPQSIGIKPPAGGFKEGGWYGGRQYVGGTLSDPGVIHPGSTQQGAGQLVSPEVNLQSDAAQGNNPGDIEKYLATQRQKAASVAPTATYNPNNGYGASAAMPSGGGSGAGTPGGMAQPAALDLTAIYDRAYADAGISDLEKQLSERERQYTESRGENNDNPFLSEATRVGREAKLEKLFGERTANLRNEVAMKKADIETKLNLSMKQFDINSQAAKQALDQFNTLLSLGALDGASGEDIANITRSTGISSDMIQSVLKANKAKSVRSQLVTNTDDAGNVTTSVIDLDSGQIISQNSLGRIGNAQSSGGGAKLSQYDQEKNLKSEMVQALELTKNSYGHIGPQDWQGALASWVSRGGDADQFVKNFKQYTDPNRGDFDEVYYQRD